MVGNKREKKKCGLCVWRRKKEEKKRKKRKESPCVWREKKRNAITIFSQ